MELTEEIMYEALVAKDASFDGIFWVGVKTTGIFCRPVCTARKPKPENVEYFSLIQQALQHGYRPCKRCHPLEMPDATPEGIKKLIDSFLAQPDKRIKEWDIRQLGMEPHTVRRWFLKNYGITFQAFQRMSRINNAFGKLQQGATVSDAAYDSGYESLSGFAESFKAITGISPSESKDAAIVSLTRIDTPLGPMFACASDAGLCVLEFTDRRMLETEFKDIARRLKAVIVPGEHPIFGPLREQLAEYFAGTRQAFDIPLHTPGTDFQQEVWQYLQTVPYGKTQSYKQQAEAISRPKAVRAVASANGHNRISIIIPCHRIIGDNGQLTGYGGGLWRKKWLLQHEMGQSGLFE